VGPDHWGEVNKQVQLEIDEGRYVKVNSKPTIVSALGAIPKESGGYRLIHDCSRPAGRAVNDYIEVESFSFQTVDEALTLVSPGAYCVKVDLKSAYRSIPISVESQQYTGLQWKVNGVDEYFVDTRLPFGARASPGIFHRITQAVARMLQKRGFPNVRVYLDDFIIVDKSKKACRQAMQVLLQLLRELGFHINWEKVEGPTQVITFLGIRIDTVKMTLSIPQGKLDQIQEVLTKFKRRHRASKKQLQSLVGKLSWVARVIPAGRIYLRALIEGIKVLKLAQHKVILTRVMKLDLDWWSQAMPLLNDTLPIKDNRPVTSMVMDSCTLGCGASFGKDWFYNDWEIDWPSASKLHINYKEVLCTVLASRRWGHQWRNTKVIVYTDSMVAKGMLTKARSKNALVTEALKELFLTSIVYNFQVIPVHLPGKMNVLADRISRIRFPKEAMDLLTVLPLYTGRPVICTVQGLGPYVSLQVLLFLCLQGCPLLHGKLLYSSR